MRHTGQHWNGSVTGALPSGHTFGVALHLTSVQSGGQRGQHSFGGTCGGLPLGQIFGKSGSTSAQFTDRHSFWKGDIIAKVF